MLGLAVILYYFSIEIFMNSWPINSDTCTNVISIGLGYLINHVVSTKFMIDITPLSSYCVIFNRPVICYIMVTAFRCKFYFFNLLVVTYGTIIYTQSLFHVISPAFLAGNLAYFYLRVLYIGKWHNLLLPSRQRL